ncbi:CLUMA_CG018456, isoform A [Clunio marinus]|uniref:CLUMA_CG018456, isoform A n=1 Tax=Clunio marinus TaxID=568069 RepID=A0A1J1J1U9_9DIPT|nr:CLUMA_CG018456, isoform A [Clunio marinus]
MFINDVKLKNLSESIENLVKGFLIEYKELIQCGQPSETKDCTSLHTYVVASRREEINASS